MKYNTRYAPLNKIKGRIKELDLTYRDVSEATGIPVNTLSNKLNGHSIPDIMEVELLIRALQIPPNQIHCYFLPNSCETQQTPADTEEEERLCSHRK